MYNDTTIVKTYEDKSAVVNSKSYGIPYYDNIVGTLVYANPRNACSSVDNAQVSNWIAFVPDYDDCIAENVRLCSLSLVIYTL